MRLFLVALVLVAMSVTSSSAQLTGLDLYNAMGERGFMGMEESARLNWLPADMGYLESEQHTNGTICVILQIVWG